jgi:hypothetical protein
MLLQLITNVEFNLSSRPRKHFWKLTLKALTVRSNLMMLCMFRWLYSQQHAKYILLNIYRPYFKGISASIEL